MEGQRVRKAEEVEIDLERIFVTHLPDDERSLYLLVDQRIGHQGNWIMPEGRPCQLISHFEADGIRYARFKEGEGEELEIGVLPVGEIRTADAKVFKLDAPA